MRAVRGEPCGFIGNLPKTVSVDLFPRACHFTGEESFGLLPGQCMPGFSELNREESWNLRT